ncbi:TnsD family Tn7-like transposition protein [Caballeronia telluris]|uniref:Uncharacterized protein n=1 Tax=Caballeronia telluris TaxID=326475 RepID=A0A158KGY6_9BURK|nr:TnsD family Tn7-like transposition protein [Caballeronia telluris]SAL80029.1 hypothetical protein AWB66_06166 [Caballeronia telluris]
MAVALLPLMDNETIGSNLGRYAKMMGLRSTIHLRKRLFGYGCLPGTRLPSAISYLASQASDYWSKTAEELINEHTEFLYTTRMASTSARENLLERMLAHPLNHDASWRNLYPIHAISTRLRYCSECLAALRGHRTPLYWKVNHQLGGVFVCLEHFCILKSVAYHYDDKNDDFPVEELISESDETVLKENSSSKMTILADIAKRSVGQKLSGFSSNSTVKYIEMFREAGFARTADLLKRDALIESWLNFFGNEFCHVLGMTPKSISSWIFKLSGPADVWRFPNPLMFIAAETFLEWRNSMPGSFVPSMKGNAIVHPKGPRAVTPSLDGLSCEGALHRATDELQFAGMLRRSGGFKLVCTCGISYRVRGADSRETEKLTPFLYASRYRMRFRRLIAKGVSYQSARRELRLTRSTALKWVRLELQVSEEKVPRREIERLRAEWRLLVSGISSEGRITAAASSNPAVYRALLRSDRDWLLTFNRRHRSWRPKSSYRVFEPTTEQIREAWHELMLMEPPVQVTQLAVLERIGWLRANRSSSLPVSVLLRQLAESRAAYHERVIAWLATLPSKQSSDTCDDALRRVGVRWRSFTKEQRNRIQQIDGLTVNHRGGKNRLVCGSSDDCV